MRRFFLGSKKGREVDKEVPKDSSTGGDLSVQQDALHPKDFAYRPFQAGPEDTHKKGYTAQNSPALPAKQVAFGGVEKIRPIAENYFQALHHEPHQPASVGFVCLPARNAQTSEGMSRIIAPDAISGVQHLQVPSPSQLTRQASMERRRSIGHDLISRALLASPIRSDTAPLAAKSEQASRSLTSMSQNTTTSSTSHTSGRQNFYTTASAKYPNLAVLATYSRDINAATAGDGIAQHLTWSEVTNDDLVDNLGSRERTRQEVLFEIVCSEERYVQELLVSGQLCLLSSRTDLSLQQLLRDNYLKPLLDSSCDKGTALEANKVASAEIATKRSQEWQEVRHPLSRKSPNTVSNVAYATKASEALAPAKSNTLDQDASSTHLPIAARFKRRVSVDSQTEIATAPSIKVACSRDEAVHTRYRDGSGDTTNSGNTVTDNEEEIDTSLTHRTSTNARNPFHFLHISDSSQSPTIPSPHKNSSSTIGAVTIPGVFKHHLKSLAPLPPKKLHKGNKARIAMIDKNSPLILPEDLRIVCENIVDHLLTGHSTLLGRLKSRYEEQYRESITMSAKCPC